MKVIGRRGMKRAAVAAFALSLSAALAGMTGLAVIVDSGQDLVKLRNAFLMEIGDEGAFDWQPDRVPFEFLQEFRHPPELFPSVIGAVLGPDAQTLPPWQKALSIAGHLVQNQKRSSPPIQSSTQRAYLQIVERGIGYCADYTQVFNALALTAGLAVREWGMSFDGYGGDGHAFNEVFDPSRNKWLFIDSFNSFYVVDENKEPLSVGEFWERLRAGTGHSLTVVPIEPEKFAFSSLDRAITYYERGRDSLFMVWGNNVFSYDSHPSVRLGGAFSRSAEQLAAMLAGIHPRLLVEEGRYSKSGMEELLYLRWLLIGSALAAVLCIMSGAVLYRLKRNPILESDSRSRHRHPSRLGLLWLAVAKGRRFVRRGRSVES